jgi:hypothetical protein
MIRLMGRHEITPYARHTLMMIARRRAPLHPIDDVESVHARKCMPPLNPDAADLAPDGPVLTDYDEEHAVTYVGMLDADAEGADWREVSRIVLRMDPKQEPDRARRAFDSHLARAKWVARHGYRELLRSGWPR